ncbi:MAG: GtrA family protein, partial [Selenomonadaceae bacterium]|nr:GtrA family protein [Selenomonadaceae bacterium]
MKEELFKFLIAGGSCFIIELIILYSLTEFIGFNYLTSSAIAFTVAVVINYIMCVRWVFDTNKKQTLTTKLIFITTSVAGLGINQLCMWLFVEFLDVYYMLAKIFATAIVTIWNFITK